MAEFIENGQLEFSEPGSPGDIIARANRLKSMEAVWETIERLGFNDDNIGKLIIGENGEMRDDLEIFQFLIIQSKTKNDITAYVNRALADAQSVYGNFDKVIGDGIIEGKTYEKILEDIITELNRRRKEHEEKKKELTSPDKDKAPNKQTASMERD